MPSARQPTFHLALPGERAVLRETASLRRALGVTRLARVTGLDRTGVEVACAVRPRGHVLQVTNGKGRSFRRAAWGALMEAAELSAAEQLNPATLCFGTVAELERAGLHAWAPEVLEPHAGPFSSTLRWAFCEARRWSGDAVWVPAHAVHCPPSGGLPLGPQVLRWTSNGWAAHPRLEAAKRHALLELVERDQLARCAPRGFTLALARERLLSPDSLPSALARRLEALTAARFQALCFDLTPQRGLGVPVAGAVLLDPGGPVPVSAGYAARFTGPEALEAALEEAAQSRLTDIHGAREEATTDRGDPALDFWNAVTRLRPRRSVTSFPSVAAPLRTARGLERLLTAAGFPDGAYRVVRLPGVAVQVVRALVLGLRRSELLG